MRHHFGLLVLVLSILLTLPLPVIAAQDGTNAAPVDPNCGPQDVSDATWEGVCKPVALVDLAVFPALPLLAASVPNGDATPAPATFEQLGMVPFLTVFAERYAATSSRSNTQYMTTYVQEGEFVLDVPANGPNNAAVNQVLVKAAQPVELVFRNSLDAPNPPYLTFQPAQTRDCTVGCIVAAGEAVVLKPGDSATTAAGAFCLWCLINGTPYVPSNGTPAPDGSSQAGALLSQAVLPFDLEGRAAGDFGWSRDWNTPVVASTHGSSTSRFAWAFNPGSNCRGG